jgi:hypothetical protein
MSTVPKTALRHGVIFQDGGNVRRLSQILENSVISMGVYCGAWVRKGTKGQFAAVQR